MIRITPGLLVALASLGIFAMTSVGHCQNDAEAKDLSWEESVRLFNEGLDSNLSPNDDPNNGAVRLIEIMKRYRAIEELEDLARKYDKLIVIDEDDRVDEESALRSEVARRRLELTDDLVKEIREVLKADYFDFGVDRSAGFNMLIPHLSPLRQIARLLEMRAKILIRESKWDEAKMVLVDLLDLSVVTREDETLISSLVGASIAAMAFNILEEAMTEQRLDAQSAMPFRMATMYLSRDPYGFRGALSGEYELLEANKEYFVNKDIDGIMSLGVTDEDKAYLTGLDPESFQAVLEKTRAAYDQVADVLDADDEEQMVDLTNQFMDDLSKGKHGPLATMFVEPWAGIMFNMLRIGMFHEAMAESLRQITRGVDPGYFGNARRLYDEWLPKVGRISVSDQETMTMVRNIVLVSGTCDALPESLREQLQSVFEMLRPVRTGLLRAAKIRRCIDWSRQNRMFKGDGYSIGPKVREMQAAGRLLLTEAALGICQHEDGLETGKQVSDSLIGALGIAIHMADGSHLMGQLAATALLEEIAELLQLGMKNGSVDSNIVSELQERLQRCQGNDLLNWKKTQRMLHGTRVLETIETFGMTDRNLSRRLARGWSDDRLFLAQFYDGGRPASEDSPLESPKFIYGGNGRQGDLHSLDHIFNPSDHDLEMLEGPHERLLQLINAIDTVESPSISEWKLRSFEAYEKIEALEKKLTPARPPHGMKKPDAGKMNKGMDGKMGH